MRHYLILRRGAPLRAFVDNDEGTCLYTPRGAIGHITMDRRGSKAATLFPDLSAVRFAIDADVERSKDWAHPHQVDDYQVVAVEVPE